jgi:hypothetical protein
MRAAVEAHHAGAAVIFEAEALDRELSSPAPEPTVLLRAIESFSRHYPAVLLHSRDATLALGKACLAGAGRAPPPDLRQRYALALTEMLDRILEEAEREGPWRVGHVPELCRSLLQELGHIQEDLPDPGCLLVPLNLIGRRVLQVADEGQPPQDWFALLDAVANLLLANTRQRLRAEPWYDGRWDSRPDRSLLHLGWLDPVRRERLEEDLRWLDSLATPLARMPSRSVEVFLDLSSYQRRDRRAGAWDRWLQDLSQEAARATFPAGLLRELCQAIADWIAGTRDRHFLSRLASSLADAVPAILDRQDAAGAGFFMSTVGNAVVRRLEAEAGRGDIDDGLHRLCALLHRALRSLSSREESLRPAATDLALRARLGPLVGKPLATPDLMETLAWAESCPEAAEALLRRAVSGLEIEECLFVPETRRLRAEDMAAALGRLLSAPRPPAQRHTVRALLRLARLSPYHLGEPGLRGRLMALAPADHSDSFLSDLRRAVLEQPVPQARRAVEQVLRYLQCADRSALDGLASPESLVALPRLEDELRVSDLRCLIRSLARCVPGASETAVEWMAQLPEPYTDPGTLRKLAGFEGCAPAALQTLAHLLGLYRALRPRTDSTGRADPGLALDLEKAARRIDERRELGRAFFGEGAAAKQPARDGLDALAWDLELQREALECLSGWRGLASRPESTEPLQRTFALLLENARLSGIGNDDTRAGAEAWSRAAAGDRPALLSRLQREFLAIRERTAAAFLPHVEDSLRRLRTNPLARPTEAFRDLVARSADEPLEKASARVNDALCDDLLNTDGALESVLACARRLESLLAATSSQRI